MAANKPLKIFLVDDDPFCLQIVEQHLKNHNYQDITLFSNGTACLNNLTSQPDIIFLDHGMDILDGIEVLKKIKRFNPDIFVVFISSQEEIEIAVSSLKYGAFDYIVKGNNELDRILQTMTKINYIKDKLKAGKFNFIKRLLSVI